MKELDLSNDPRQPGRTRLRTAQHNAEEGGHDTALQIHHEGDLLAQPDMQCLLFVHLARSTFNAGRKRRENGAEGRKEIFYRDAKVLATKEEIEKAMREDRPPRDTPELPDCPVKDLKTRTSYAQAVHSDQRGIWEDSMAREFHGFKEMGTIDVEE